MATEETTTTTNTMVGIAAPPPKPWERPDNNNTQSVLSVIQPDTSGTLVNNANLSNPITPINHAPVLPTQPYYLGRFPGGYNNYGYSPSYLGNSQNYGFQNIPEQFLPPGTILGDAEMRVRTTLATINALVRAFSGLAQMLDSTVYAAWSSIMAAVTVANQFRHLKQDHLKKWVEIIKSSMNWLLQTLKLSHQSNRIKKTSEAILSPTTSTPIPRVESSRRGTFLPSATSIIAPALVTGLTCLFIWQFSYLKKRDKPLALARYHFSSHDPACLELQAGDELTLLRAPEESGWTLVHNLKSGASGYVPSEYIKLVDSQQ